MEQKSTTSQFRYVLILLNITLGIETYKDSFKYGIILFLYQQTLSRYSRNQFQSNTKNLITYNHFTIIVFVVYVSLGLLLSLQPTFYPSEAEKRGAKPSEYGFVFGIANLSLFVFGPVFGKFGSQLGLKLCFNIGAVMQGVSGFLFAFVASLNDVTTFLTFSYILRFLEGMGTAMAWSSSLGLLTDIFPSKV